MAKCVFGHLRRVEEAEAIKKLDTVYKDQDNRDFINLYMDIFSEKREQDSKVAQPPKPVYKSYVNNKLTYTEPLPKYAFCECRNHHLVGIIIDQRYYFTDVSMLRLMFPQGHYEDWSDQFWEPNYTQAFELQNKLNLKRAQET